MGGGAKNRDSMMSAGKKDVSEAEQVTFDERLFFL